MYTGCWSSYEDGTYDVITKKEDLEGLFRCIEANILVKQKENEELWEELKRVKSEAYKDEEIAKLKEQADEYWEQLRYGFGVTKEEHDKVYQWQKNHDATEHNNLKGYHGVSGGGYSYMFYPTSIGVFWHCECDICKRKAMDAAYATGAFDKNAYAQYMKVHNGKIEFDDV